MSFSSGQFRFLSSPVRMYRELMLSPCVNMDHSLKFNIKDFYVMGKVLIQIGHLSFSGERMSLRTG